MRTPAAWVEVRPSTIAGVKISPGATTATPGGYGAIKSALIHPTASEALTISESAKYASLIEIQICGITDQLKEVADGRGVDC